MNKIKLLGMTAVKLNTPMRYIIIIFVYKKMIFTKNDRLSKFLFPSETMKSVSYLFNYYMFA